MHLLVDPKNRVYACVTASDVPSALAFSLLEEVRCSRLVPATSAPTFLLLSLLLLLWGCLVSLAFPLRG